MAVRYRVRLTFPRGADLMRRMRRASQALDLAVHTLNPFGSKTVTGMFCENLQLDFRADAVRKPVRRA